MDRSYKLLLLDDDDVDRMAVRRYLAGGPLRYELTECSTVAAARAHLAANSYDCILLDYMLPGVDGMALLRELRADHDTLPIIMLTGQGDRETAVALMKAGADDFLSKSHADAQLLAQSIRAAVRTHRAERAARQARQARDRSERRYRFLAESIPQMVWITKPELAVDYVNQRYVDYTGLTVDALAESGLESAFHPDDLAASSARWEVARRQHTAYEYQHRLRSTRTGEYRWHLSRAEPLVDGEGRIQQWFGTSTDIDDQKRLEERQAAQVHESEAARKHAEELNRAKDDFLAVLSHELRTPLHAISGWLQILRSAELSSERANQAIDSIDRNTRSQTRLIEDLLDVSRIVSGKLSIQRRPVELGALLRAAADVVLPIARARGVELRVELPSTLGLVQGDASRLQQVAWNLLSNAIKFSEREGTVTLRAQAGQEALSFSVVDEGSGIAPDFLPHVFERFRQEDSSTTRKQGGLGLGLSIVRHLVELHEGSIQAASEGEGLGATFTVSLPTAEPDGGRTSIFPSSPPQKAAVATPLSGIRVLLVDDDDDSRDMMLSALELHGASVREASSAEDGRALFNAERPDAIVSDIGMPGEDGYSLMRSLRAVDTEIFAIALTGYAAIDDRERARNAGFNAHLTKPVDLAALVAALLRGAGPGR